MRLAVLAFCSFLLSGPRLQEPTQPPPERIDVPGDAAEVPMGDIGGRPTVDATINGKGPYHFILDTGASITVIGDDLRDELGLAATGEAAGPGGILGQLVRIDALRIGEVSLRGVKVTAGPISRMFRGPDAPRGVLSAASFPDYVLTIDYPARRVRIRKGELPAADGKRIFQYTAEQVLPNVTVRVGGTEVRAHIDSGSPGALTVPTKYMQELALASKPEEVGRARTSHGEFTVWSAKPGGTIELGEFKLELNGIDFSDVNPIPGPPTGNIGYRVLKDFVVTMDSKNRRIRLDR